MVLGLHQEKQSIQCKVQVDYAYESSYQRKALSLHGEYNLSFKSVIQKAI